MYTEGGQKRQKRKKQKKENMKITITLYSGASPACRFPRRSNELPNALHLNLADTLIQSDLQ